MREMVLASAAAIILAFGLSNASAMGGSGDLSPSESPYAILDPQTVTPLPAPVVESEPPPASRIARRRGVREPRTA
jgi:hypothetical protein